MTERETESEAERGKTADIAELLDCCSASVEGCHVAADGAREIRSLRAQVADLQAKLAEITEWRPMACGRNSEWKRTLDGRTVLR
jgi:hypothetical protein